MWPACALKAAGLSRRLRQRRHQHQPPRQHQHRWLHHRLQRRCCNWRPRPLPFNDFVEEDVAGYSDEDIGAASRVVHEGCRKVLREHFTLAPVRSESEGQRLTLPIGFDTAANRITGNVVGQAPFTGTLAHRGWRATDTRLPRLAPSHDATVLAQAEIEQ